ncbi:MAG: sulfur carrier protein ThiS adenylyltransferase ThiF [Bacteroidales bacterium]|nr:sulfur carrier protein ThiS adenylyltransferase ThiF [Bacteroidales bacterium]HOY38794.1 sulfur carrier protein ThiS adenylyltransferase ThiF [Bacteroidales bacterium]HQP03991.1 sulfur carrier protein ThiS adenylyltransferase ThiF [Bacteroidales bacterium]
MNYLSFDEIKKRLSQFKVGIAGCGGLGSNCAVALARTGIGSLVLVDFDKVSEGNLNRQYFFTDQLGQKKTEALRYNLNKINASCHIETHNLKIQANNVLSVFSGCDVIVEAFDAADQKKMFIETCMSQLASTPLVCGIGLAGYGSNNMLSTVQYDKNLYICGDQTYEVFANLPPLAPRVGIVANMQANQVLEILLKQ